MVQLGSPALASQWPMQACHRMSPEVPCLLVITYIPRNQFEFTWHERRSEWCTYTIRDGYKETGLATSISQSFWRAPHCAKVVELHNTWPKWVFTINNFWCFTDSSLPYSYSKMKGLLYFLSVGILLGETCASGQGINRRKDQTHLSTTVANIKAAMLASIRTRRVSTTALHRTFI